MPWLIILLLALPLSVCSREPNRPPASADTALEPGRADGGPDGTPPFELTEKKLDSYVAYRHLRLAPELDGGIDTEPSTSPEGIRRQALAEQKARERVGLSLREVKDIDAMVQEVIGKRVLGRMILEDRGIQQIEELKGKLPVSEQKQLEASIQETRRSQVEAADLPNQRRKYGSANVDRILAREAELTKLWNERMVQSSK